MNTTPLSLLLRIRDADDKTAWSEFDCLYRPMLKHFATSRGLRESDVDDTVQDCMASIHAHIGSFQYDRAKGTFKSWLRTLVNNRVRNLLRKRRERTVDQAAWEKLAIADVDSDDVFEKIWFQEHVRHALGILQRETTPLDYLAFTWYAMNGVPTSEVVAKSGKTPNQLYKLKFRLSRRLREIVSELAEGLE